MKILMCQFGTETNTFAPGLMEFEQEAPYGWMRGEEVLEKLATPAPISAVRWMPWLRRGSLPCPST